MEKLQAPTFLPGLRPEGRALRAVGVSDGVVGNGRSLTGMVDGVSERYGDLLSGSYDCVDRVVLNAYFSLGHSPGGFRTWWRRWHDGSDDELDNAHLMRMAGRFARRVRAWGHANGVEVIDCKGEDRKHRIAEEYLSTHAVTSGVFLILVARAPTTVWDVTRSTKGHIVNLAKKKSYVNHYSFHIIDPDFGHVTIKMSGHAPFAAQVIVNGHEYVAAQAAAAGIGYTKEGNCFTATPDPAGLARIADTLSAPPIAGRLGQVCDRWIYTACLCFGLDLVDQERGGFRYSYSIYQVEYSRNLIFASGARLDRMFESMVDRTRSRLDVPKVRTMFGAKGRPHRKGGDLSPRQGIVIERPRWDLTIFKVHFGLLTLKAYSKGEHVLRFEAVVHNTRQLGTGRVLDRFPDIVGRLRAMVERFLTMLDCVDIGFIADGTLDDLPQPSLLGATRLGGIDLNKPRARAVMAAAVALSVAPDGFTAADFTAKVNAMGNLTGADYTVRQGAYDIRKLRGKHLVVKPDHSRRYHVDPGAARTMSALGVLRDQVIAPILAGVAIPRQGRKPATWTNIDQDYETLRVGMLSLFGDLGLATAA